MQAYKEISLGSLFKGNPLLDASSIYSWLLQLSRSASQSGTSLCEARRAGRQKVFPFSVQGGEDGPSAVKPFSLPATGQSPWPQDGAGSLQLQDKAHQRQNLLKSTLSLGLTINRYRQITMELLIFNLLLCPSLVHSHACPSDSALLNSGDWGIFFGMGHGWRYPSPFSVQHISEPLL